jgi:hypothetical protein
MNASPNQRGAPPETRLGYVTDREGDIAALSGGEFYRLSKNSMQLFCGRSVCRKVQQPILP